MEHTRTTHEQSVILKKIGYDVPDTHYYNQHLNMSWISEIGEEDTYNSGLSWHYTRPKLTDVATHLRNVHGWHVAVIAETKNKFWTYIVTDCEGFEYHYGKADNETSFNTHDIALSAGVDFILKKLDTHA